jgi:hypothetical protein
LETESEDELSEPPPEDDADSATPLTPAARKRLLKAHLKFVKESIAGVSKTIVQTESLLDIKDSRIEAAEIWTAAFRAENQPADIETRAAAGYATNYELRAYHVWHTNKDLAPEGVAKLLRSPPLKTGTVANYIWCAVKKERLPVDRLRYNKEVVELLPEKTRRFARKV